MILMDNLIIITKLVVFLKLNMLNTSYINLVDYTLWINYKSKFKCFIIFKTSYKQIDYLIIITNYFMFDIQQNICQYNKLFNFF